MQHGFWWRALFLMRMFLVFQRLLPNEKTYADCYRCDVGILDFVSFLGVVILQTTAASLMPPYQFDQASRFALGWAEL